MKINRSRLTQALLTLSCSLALSGCGGGNDEDSKQFNVSKTGHLVDQDEGTTISTIGPVDLTPIPTPAEPAGEFNVECTLSHTLPDDPIMAFGRPGEAMVHDFFGNIHANAFSTADMLLAYPQTTCTSKADGSSYWAPQLRRKSTGEIIKPSAMKTYYQNNDTRYPARPFPRGLQLMVGEHRSTQSKQGVLYFCQAASNNGGSYYTDPPESCPLIDGKHAQFNLAFRFADCWDGKNIKPSHHGPRNAAYSVNGQCPTNYPVKIPQLQLNVSYMLYDNANLADLELSTNPERVGGVLEPRWLSLYSAHADFFNGWRDDAMEYALRYCVNNRVCDKSVPVTYAPAVADAYVDVGALREQNFGKDRALLVGSPTESKATAQKAIYMKFALPSAETLAKAPFDDVQLNLHGGNLFGEEIDHGIGVYATSNDWDEMKITGANAPACGQGAYIHMWYDYTERPAFYRQSGSVKDVVNRAIQRGDKEVSFCLQGGTPESYVSSRETATPPMLFFK